ncbi:hypothetical protein BKA62DRAFT_688006 [Auriculariales sp. MPI-PUGE-AT-0066]|nr:hypothetical protein BKA62DRAFT_688006 [Auriculariales sp. MPI-PUGE-AT-0066]
MMHALTVQRHISLLAIWLAVLPLLSLASLVVVPASDTRQIQYLGSWTLPTSTSVLGANETAPQCPPQSQAAISSTPGDEVVLTFTGTYARIIATAGPETAAFSVTQDTAAPQFIDIGAFNESSCKVVFETSTLPRGSHTIRVKLVNDNANSPGKFVLLSFGYDTEPGESKSPVVTIVVAVCASIAGFGITFIILFLCCKRSRRTPDLERPTRPNMAYKPGYLYDANGKGGHMRLPSEDALSAMNKPYPVPGARTRSPAPVRTLGRRLHILYSDLRLLCRRTNRHPEHHPKRRCNTGLIRRLGRSKARPSQPFPCRYLCFCICGFCTYSTGING